MGRVREDAHRVGKEVNMRSGRVDHAFQGAVLRLVVFVIEEQRYALPLAAVERILPMVAVSPLPEAPAVALGVINVHGQVLPVLDIRRRFGLPPRDYDLRSHLLLARTSRRTLALPVDEVLGVSEVAAEAVAPPDAILPGIGHVAGIVALADGLLFIHDLDAFLSLDEERRLTESLEEIGR
jgi:purine-binding chemotaxis protein CheW